MMVLTPWPAPCIVYSTRGTVSLAQYSNLSRRVLAAVADAECRALTGIHALSGRMVVVVIGIRVIFGHVCLVVDDCTSRVKGYRVGASR